MPASTQLIRWQSYNMPSDYVNIFLSRDNGNIFEPLATDLKNGGAYPLTTPDLLQPINDALIKIEDASDNSAYEISEKFSISNNISIIPISKIS